MPLCRGRLIKLKDDKQVWVSFKYERLSNICYWCGRLTHNDKDCEIWIESEGTLRNDQKEFGPCLRAPPFLVFRKNTMVVPSYYSTRKMSMKAGQTSQPMEEEHNPNGSVRFRQGTVTHSMCNGNKGINPTDHACSVSSLPLNPNLNGISSCSKGIDSVLNERNEESQKSERSGLSPDTLGLSKSRDLLKETSPSQPNEAFPPHVPDRASQKIVQGRILPSWTRINRPPTVLEIPPTLFTTGRKRPIQSQVSSELSEVPLKRYQASQKNDEGLFILVEAYHQPCQEQWVA